MLKMQKKFGKLTTSQVMMNKMTMKTVMKRKKILFIMKILKGKFLLMIKISQLMNMKLLKMTSVLQKYTHIDGGMMMTRTTTSL